MVKIWVEIYIWELYAFEWYLKLLRLDKVIKVPSAERKH